MHPSIQVFVDFDGTISRADTTDLLLQRFASAAWRDVEQAWERGEIGSRECMVRQVDLLRVSPQSLEEFAAGVELDEAFPAFARFCASAGVQATVVSDGLDRIIEAALQRMDLALPVKANRLVSLGGDRWKLQFPHASNECRSLAGHCKCRSMTSEPALTILIGDGRSDFCAAREADFVFAKARLLDHCREHSLPHASFTSFTELSRLFASWLETVRSKGAATRQLSFESENHAE